MLFVLCHLRICIILVLIVWADNNFVQLLLHHYSFFGLEQSLDVFDYIYRPRWNGLVVYWKLRHELRRFAYIFQIHHQFIILNVIIYFLLTNVLQQKMRSGKLGFLLYIWSTYMSIVIYRTIICPYIVASVRMRI